MPNRPINAPDSFRSPYYSQAVEVVGDTRTLHISGQVPVTPGGSVPQGFDSQARLVFTNIEAQLEAAGMSIKHLVTLTAFLVDRQHLPTFRRVRDAVLKGHLPASTLVFAELVDPAWMLEVNATAVA